MKKKLLFEIDGFEVYDNTVYTVKDKPDYDAPSGFVDRGITRLPSDGVDDTFTCNFASIEPGSSDGLWDTGFYEGSRCYSKITDRALREAKVKNAVENVMEPYNLNLGGGDRLGQSKDNDFWDTKFFRVYTGQVFNTAVIQDRVSLYFALLTGHLTPEGQEGNSRFKKSTYVVLDINKNMKRKEEKALLQFEAISSFMGILKADKNRMLSVLDYIGITTSEDIKESTLMGMFKQMIEEDESKLKLYNNLIEESETQEGRAKLEIYRELRSRFPGKGVTRSSNGVYFYKDEEIGGDLKTAASNIATQKHFEEIKKDLILGEDED